MPGRKPRRTTGPEAIREYRLREKLERGDKVAGQEAEWLDRRGTAANASKMNDAETRHAKHNNGRGW